MKRREGKSDFRRKDKAYRAQEKERRRHNRLMKTDPEYRAAHIAKKDEENRSRQARSKAGHFV